MTYWSSDQLIAQYPIMGALSVVVIAWPLLAARFSATSLYRVDTETKATSRLPDQRAAATLAMSTSMAVQLPSPRVERRSRW